MTAAEYRAARLSLGLTQEQLARALGVTVTTISRRETGVRPITERTRLEIERLAAEKKFTKSLPDP